MRVIGEGHRVINNYLEGLTGDDARAGISLMTGIKDSPLNGYSPVVNCLIAHNTILDCKQPVLIGLADDDVDAAVTPRNCVVSNNLIVGCTGPLVIQHSEPQVFQGSGNLTFGAEAAWPAGVTGIVANPRLIPDANELRRPAMDSPVRSTATDSVDVLIDIDGDPRGPRQDIGCDQFTNAMPQFRPLLRGDVGPEWTHGP